MPTYCPICGEEVKPPRRSYCSKACAYRMKQLGKRAALPNRHKDDTPVYYPRVCPDCGASYVGHIKSVRCSACQDAANRRANAAYRMRKAKGNERPIGSTDYCEACGEPYIVMGSLQRYCKRCAPAETLGNKRAASREWNAKTYADEAKREAKNQKRRKPWKTPRPCSVCGTVFIPNAPAHTICSAECKNKRLSETQKKADARRAETKIAKIKAARAAEKSLPQEEQDRLRAERNAKARENYAKRKALKAMTESASAANPDEQ